MAGTNVDIDGASVSSVVRPSDVAEMPEVPSQQADHLQKAPSWNNSGYDEASTFDAMYDEVASSYYPDTLDVKARGRQVLRLFGKWKPTVESFVQASLRNQNLDDDLGANITFEPEGSSEAIVRPLSEATFGNASYNFTPNAAGEYEWIPNGADGDTETATANEQAFMIFGYIDYNSSYVTPYDYVQADIDDSHGVRRPFYLRNQMSQASTLSVADRERGPLMVFPNRSLDLDLNVVNPDVRSGLFPVGVEVVVASANNFGGIQDA